MPPPITSNIEDGLPAALEPGVTFAIHRPSMPDGVNFEQKMDGDQELSPQEFAALLGMGRKKREAHHDLENEDTEEEEETFDAEVTEEELMALFRQGVNSVKIAVQGMEGNDTTYGIFDGCGPKDDRNTQEVLDEDFSPEDRPIFYALKAHMKALTAKNTSGAARMEQLRWLMMPIADSNGLTFRDACEALMCRPHVLRTRAIYQMWYNGIAVDSRLPDLAAPLPKFLSNEIKYNQYVSATPGVLEVSKLAWAMPGQPLERMILEAVRLQIKNPLQAFQVLEDYNYVGKTKDHRVYFITRNPTALTLRKRSAFSWAASLVAADD